MSLFPICVEVYSPNLYTTGHAETAGKVGEKQRRRQLLKELKRDVLMQKHYKNARRLTRPRPGFKHLDYFPFHTLGMSSFPLTNFIIFQDGYCTPNQIVNPFILG